MATRILLAVAWLISIAWLLLLAAAPRWISPPSTGPAHAIAVATYVVGGRVCHQRPERSFRLDAVPMPVCARCAGLYLGIPIGLAFAGRRRAAGSRTPVSAGAARTALIWAALPTLATVGLEWLTGFVVPALVRFGLGVVVAGVAAWACAERLVVEAGPGR